MLAKSVSFIPYSTISDFAIKMLALSLSMLAMAFPECVQAQTPGGGGIGLLDSVRITMEKQPDVLSREQDVEFSKGGVQIEAGAFDTTLNPSYGYEREDTPLTEAERKRLGLPGQVIDTTTAAVGMSKQFRTGVTISPTVQVIQTRDVHPSFGTTNDSTVNVLITIPLLQGLGIEATGANEMAAKKDLEISLLSLRFGISRDILTTVSSYWDYLAALKSLEQRRTMEASAERIYKEVKTLIEGDERAASEIEQVAANLANRTALCTAAEQGLVQAKHGLGLAMGLPFEEIQSLSLPSDQFPPISSLDIRKVSTAINYFTEQSLLRRADYEASKKSEEATKILLVAAKRNLLPQLSLQVGAGYSGIEEGPGFSRFMSSLQDNIPGYSGTVSLNYKWPFKNNTARGLLLQRAADYQKATINTKDLARNISSSIAQDLSALKNNAEELIKYREAVEHYEKAVENERLKFLAGMSTINDIITTEDNLSNALVSRISAESSYSKALAQLRFDTGTILTIKDDHISVSMEELVTIPFLQDIGHK